MAELNYEAMCNGVLKDIENIAGGISRMKRDIERLKPEEKEIPSYTPIVNSQEDLTTTKEDESDNDVDKQFEESIVFYLDNYRLLREGFTEHEIGAILPRTNNPDYTNILLRLSLESTKELNALKELLNEEGISDDDKALCEKLIAHEKRKIAFIYGRLFANETNTEVEETFEKNKIVLVPTLCGDIRVIDEFEHIPVDFYDGFLELVNSIIDGTFKNVKMLRIDNIPVSIFEVKMPKLRLVFARLNANTYGLITAFIKKSYTDRLYRETLLNKIRDYYLIEEKLKANLNNQEFMDNNDYYVSLMFNILNRSDAKSLRKENK